VEVQLKDKDHFSDRSPVPSVTNLAKFESFSNVVLTKPWKSPKAEAIPNITAKPKPAIIVTIQVPVPRFSGTANNGLGIKKSITNKSTLESLYMVRKFYVFSMGAIVKPLLTSC